jgi:hypothetical protein
LSLVLRHFDPERKIVVEAHAFNLIVMDVLLQYTYNNILHLVAYFSRKHFPVEINYEIYDKELLAIIHTFKE